MKVILQTLLAAGILIAATAPRALGDTIIEPIGPITVVPGQQVELVFPNEFDLIHAKRVTFDGTILSIGTSGQLTELSIKFDWFDPSDPADPIKFSPAFLLPISATGGPTHASLEYFIPFCPPQVSIDFAINSGEPVIIEGVFTHECVTTVPELCGTLGLLGLGLTSLVGGRRALRL